MTSQPRERIHRIEYRTTAKGAGWTDKRRRGRLRFAGADAASFLQALVSNDVAALEPGRGVYAVYLTPQGRMLADLRIHHRGDELLVDVAPGHAGRLASRFDRSIFSEDVRVTDVSDAVAQIGVAGPMASSILAHAFGLDPLDSRRGRRTAGTRARAHRRRRDCADRRLGAAVLRRLRPGGRVRRDGRAARGTGAAPMTEALADALRIEAGRPAYGVDMTEDTIPLEAGLLERAISQTKGCYVGQEIVVRVLHRGGGRVARRLVKLSSRRRFRTCPRRASRCSTAGGVGRVTSAAYSPTSAP